MSRKRLGHQIYQKPAALIWKYVHMYIYTYIHTYIHISILLAVSALASHDTWTIDVNDWGVNDWIDCVYVCCWWLCVCVRLVIVCVCCRWLCVCVLYCVAVCCSVLQCTCVHHTHNHLFLHSKNSNLRNHDYERDCVCVICRWLCVCVVRCVAVCCSVL